MKKAFLLFSAITCLCLAALTFKAGAQSPQWLWARQAGDISYDYGQSVATDKDGNSYMVGNYNFSVIFGAYNFTSKGSGDVFIVKYDPEGNVLWAKSAGGDDNDVASGVTVDASGNCFVAGYFKSDSITFGTVTLHNAGGNSNDPFLVKYDASGNEQWATCTGGQMDDRAYAVAADASGNAVIAGYFVSPTITFGVFTLTNTTGTDVFTVKYSPDGTVLWAQSAAGTSGGFDYANTITTDKDGNVFMAGYFNSGTLTFGAITVNKHANHDVYVVKYAPNGIPIWVRNAGVSGDNLSGGVATDSYGNCYFSGSFKGNSIVFGSTTLTNAGNADMFLVKYGPDGSVLWALGAGGSQEDGAAWVAVDKQDYVYLAGYFRSPQITFGSTTFDNALAGTYDLFATEYGQDGSLKWARYAGGTGDDKPACIAVDTLRNFFITGYFSSGDLAFGNDTIHCTGTTDIFLTKSDNMPSTGIQDGHNPSVISVYPNPATNNITIVSPRASLIQVYDFQGKICRTIANPAQQLSIDVTTLPTGIYLVKATMERGVSVSKFVKR